MKIRIDRERCQGHNRCAMICPELYKIDEESYAYVEQEEVPEELEERARRGAEVCPEQAIAVSD